MGSKYHLKHSYEIFNVRPAKWVILSSMLYDPFQQQAIEIIDKEESLIVSAPTGAGKTCIAEYAIVKALEKNEGAIYTSPIKALSNQKYRDFVQKYGDRVGIITGDVSINPNAPLLIMTTEIYRNSLFENSTRLEKARWVIFDEIHYLDDLERGTVWEEAIMFTPKSIKILGLSATVPNIQEIVNWISEIHEEKIHVITETKRPVPLTHLFQCQGHILKSTESLRKEGYQNRMSWRPTWKEKRHHSDLAHTRVKPNRLDHLVTHLEETKRLPAIYFTFARRRTEELAHELVGFNFLTPEEKADISRLFHDLCVRYDLVEENSAKEMTSLIERGIAFHHAGMLPTLKETIEQLFTSRLIKLIFTTETFALGINMPARCVIFDELRKFYGTHFANLRTRDFYQMAGRAGRRGMDAEGFVYSRLNPHYIAFPEVLRVINGDPEQVRSQFNTCYATLLNLYQSYGRELVKIYPRSLHFFQASKDGKRAGYQLIENKLRLLEQLGHINRNELTEKGVFASNLYGYELLLAEMRDVGYLDEMDECELALTLGALVFEPRKKDEKPHYSKRVLKMERTLEGLARHIYQKEYKFRIWPHSKLPHFHLGPAIEAWMTGCDFETLMKVTPIDEGEIVRYFRMISQLLRQIREAKGATDTLKSKAQSTFKKMNRDIVDAERQLRS